MSWLRSRWPAVRWSASPHSHKEPRCRGLSTRLRARGQRPSYGSGRGRECGRRDVERGDHSGRHNPADGDHYADPAGSELARLVQRRPDLHRLGRQRGDLSVAGMFKVALDTTAGAVATTPSVGGPTVYSSAATKAGLLPGAHVLYYTASDGHLNYASWASTATNIDTAPPAAPGSPALLSGPNGTLTSTWATATDNAGGSGVFSYTWR